MERADGIKRDEHGAPVPKRVRASKYRNVPMEADGIKFASILEARFFQELELRRQAGEILYFLRQVPFHLPGGVIYRIDFAEVMRHPNFQFGDLLPKREGALDLTDETPVVIKYIDCKGFDTQAGKNKIKQVEALYGVRVHLVRKVRRLRSK
jgi:hypothetical protein